MPSYYLSWVVVTEPELVNVLQYSLAFRPRLELKYSQEVAEFGVAVMMQRKKGPVVESKGSTVGVSVVGW